MCQECNVGLIESLKLDREWVIEFLVEHGVFKPEINCPQCNSIVQLNKDKLYYRCYKMVAIGKSKKRQCKKKVLAKVKTFFGNSNLDLVLCWQYITLLLHVKPPRTDLFKNELGFSARTIANWCTYARDVIIHDCLRKSEKLGGNSKYVEVVEAVSITSTIEQVGTTSQLVLSGIEIESRNSFFVVIENPESANLIAVFKEWILPNTFVVTESSMIYGCLDDKQFLEFTSQQSINFVKPKMMKQYNKSIERTWREVRLSIPSSTSLGSNSAGFLTEYQFKMISNRNLGPWKARYGICNYRCRSPQPKKISLIG
uniref:ISXO2-like transposase domain-containing protein n=1 Tax=Graphocephala atropunctata TaxID=36148 RepID=A0A1B6KIL8_9HEMI